MEDTKIILEQISESVSIPRKHDCAFGSGPFRLSPWMLPDPTSYPNILWLSLVNQHLHYLIFYDNRTCTFQLSIVNSVILFRLLYREILLLL